MKKKYLANIAPGELFTFAGEQFVVLEQRGSETFVLLAQSEESCAFRADMNEENRNNYATSDLRKRIDEWVGNLPRNSEEAAAIHEFDVDLNCTDRSGGYGTITGVRAAPLTLWQYGQFKELIPLNMDDYWWLATPWACRWLRSPYTNNTNYVWDVLTNGNCYYYYASNSYGIRPALLLSSEILVAYDGEDKDDAECDGDDETVDLSSISTKELVTELQRRLSGESEEGSNARRL